MKLKNRIQIVDTTLRDGAQMPGADLTLDNKISIVESLKEAGIQNIEIGYPSCSLVETNHIRSIRHLFPRMNFSVWARARKSDIRDAAQTDIPAIHISFPTSDRHIGIITRSKKFILEELKQLIGFARNWFDTVTVGAQDATRGSLLFLQEFIEQAVDAGVQGIRIADTVGAATPEKTSEIIRKVVAWAPAVPIEFHGHNDFGLAVANSFAALSSGAAAVSCTVCGVGERAGNAALEQVAAGAELLYDWNTGVHLDSLPMLCREVGAVFGVNIGRLSPLVGENAFTHESGIHCHGMLRDKKAYQPFEASMVGRKEKYSLGPHGGSSTVQAYLLSRGVSISRKKAADLITEIKAGRNVNCVDGIYST